MQKNTKQIEKIHKLLGFKTFNKIPKDIYNIELKDVFKLPNEENIMDYDEGQDVKEFLEMAMEPNEEGTGRFRFNQKGRNQIYLYFVGNKQHIDNIIDPNIILQVFKAFFQVQTVSIQYLEFFQFEKKFNGKRVSLIDKKKKLEFPLKARGGGKIGVFSLFDVLVEYISKNSYTNVFFIDEEIVEEDYPDENILGRACGDRVCIVSLKNQTKDELINTSLHEILHTFGIDHCIYFDCLMNALTQEDNWLQLCPIDLMKLQSELKFDSTKRYESLLNFYKNIHKNNKQIEILTNILKAIK